MMSALTAALDPRPARAGRREWVALAVLVLPLLLVSMDVSVLYFAVPFISRDLSASSTQQLWIFDIYGFVLAGLLVTMGSLGDRIGRRRLLLGGAAAFGIASLCAAYAQSAGMLILARALLGVGGATLMPSTLALVRNLFHDPVQRGKAVAVWTSALMAGISLGPVLSGLLLEHFWWGSVFLVNTPFMLLLLAAGPFLLPEFKNPGAGRFDVMSSVLSLACLLPIVYGIKHTATEGLGAVAVISLAVGAAFGLVFWRRQSRVADPMVDLRLLRNRTFAAAMASSVVATFALVGNAIFITQFLQSVLGMSPLRAALWSLVPSVTVALSAPSAGVLARKLGARAVMAAGFTMGAVGFGVLSEVHARSSLLLPLIGAGILASGLVGVMTLVTETVLGAISPERAGSASALVEAGNELGGALGIAVLGSIGTAVYRAQLTSAHLAVASSGTTTAVHDGLAGAIAVSVGLPGRSAERLLQVARGAFVTGYDAVAVVGCVPSRTHGRRGVDDASSSSRGLGPLRGSGSVELDDRWATGLRWSRFRPILAG